MFDAGAGEVPRRLGEVGAEAPRSGKVSVALNCRVLALRILLDRLSCLLFAETSSGVADATTMPRSACYLRLPQLLAATAMLLLLLLLLLGYCCCHVCYCCC